MLCTRFYSLDVCAKFLTRSYLARSGFGTNISWIKSRTPHFLWRKLYLFYEWHVKVTNITDKLMTHSRKIFSPFRTEDISVKSSKLFITTTQTKLILQLLVSLLWLYKTIVACKKKILRHFTFAVFADCWPNRKFKFPEKKIFP